MIAMQHNRLLIWSAAIWLVTHSWATLPASGQDDGAQGIRHAASEDEATARRKILESDRWRRANRAFREWLSVQQIYRPQEVAHMLERMEARVEAMSARELADYLEDMEERLKVLLSPEAEEARQWLGQFLAVARDPERQLGRPLPDVMNMSASQIRQELHEFQQRRAARQQAQAAFERSRARQARAARDVRTARRQSQDQLRDSRARAANMQFRSAYSPRLEQQTGHSELRPAPVEYPNYRFSPWGTPIRFNPLRDDYGWW
jgi:hypothetical protein